MIERKIDPQALKVLKEGPVAHRKYLCEQNLLYFGLWYFSEFFTYAIPEFHFDMYDDLMRLAAGELKEVDWVMFRESAKTSLAKIFVVWCICFKKKNYISYDSYDKSNAEAALYDIAVWLQTNKKLLHDFGNLYFGASGDLRQSKLQRVNNFITSNGVKVEAFSTGESARGRIHQNQRPDLFVLDDIENSKTKKSYAVTKGIIDHVLELKGGLAPNAAVLILGNYIIETGVIAYIMQQNKNNPDAVVRNVPVKIGQVHVWPDKYVDTDEEALEANRNRTKERRVVSLEAKQRELGESSYQTEMMNNPGAAEDNFFDRAQLEADIQRAQQLEPIKSMQHWKIWHDFKADNRYGLGADTADAGGDSCASTIIGFGTIPAKVVSTYHDDKIGASSFAFEIRRQAEYFGFAIAGVERNQTGYATITTLPEIYRQDRIYRHKDPSRQDGEQSGQYGWPSTGNSKSKMLYDFKKAYENGELEINDVELLREMLAFTKMDLSETRRNVGVTRHFDLLFSACIAWQMRDFAPNPESDKGSDRAKKLATVQSLNKNRKKSYAEEVLGD